MEYYLKCDQCGEVYKSSFEHQLCGRCNSLLEVVYSELPKAPTQKNVSFWDYENLLPNSNYYRYEVGGTKLIGAHNSENLTLKLEIENPTRSFKDRGSVVEIAKAKEYGYGKVVCASTGNMAYSIAYYAKLAGITSKIYVSKNANRDKIAEIRSTHDADIVRVNGDFTKAQARAEAYARRNRVFLTGDYCYRKEGQKTVAYEIIHALPETTHIIVPVGNATLFTAIFKALKEMQAIRKMTKLPKLIAVQSDRTAPVALAYKNRTRVKYVKPTTKADAIAVGYPTYGDHALEALRQTNGTCITVPDEAMKKEQKKFFEEYGLVAELAAVAGIVAARRIKLGKAEKAVIIVTGGNV
jgi:threonine synthase